MKKLIWIYALVLLFVMTGWTAEKSFVLKVKVQLANVRSEPDASASVIAQVKLGTLLESMGKVDSFYEITITDKNGQTVSGYIHVSVVDVMGGGEEEAVEEPRPVPRQEPVTYREPARASGYEGVSRGGFKVLGGFALTNLSLSEDIPSGISKKSKMGFGGGIGYEFGSSQFRLEIDALFIPGGAIFEGEVGENKIKMTMSGTGLGAAVLARFRLMPGSSSPYLLGGADVGYILSQKVKVDINGETNEEDISKDISRTYYGLDFGGGYEFGMGNMILFVEARYMLGLANQIKEPEEGAYIKPNGIVIFVGIKL